MRPPNVPHCGKTPQNGLGSNLQRWSAGHRGHGIARGRVPRRPDREGGGHKHDGRVGLACVKADRARASGQVSTGAIPSAISRPLQLRRQNSGMFWCAAGFRFFDPISRVLTPAKGAPNDLHASSRGQNARCSHTSPTDYRAAILQVAEFARPAHAKLG
jgi:hypothetical protein